MYSQNPSEVCFSFLDVETTGLDPYSGDKICEIAILKTIDEKVIDDYVTLVNPGKSISTGASAVNGITDDMIRGAPFFRDIAEDVVSFLNDTVIVAHNAKFDMRFLSMELGALRLSSPEFHVIDTLRIARRYYKFYSNSLGQIARCIGLPARYEHRALADVQTTKKVFEYFLMDLGKRRGIRLNKLKDVLKLQGVDFESQEEPNRLAIPPEITIPSEIENALRTKGKLQITYVSACEEKTTRVIEPLGISVDMENVCLHAFCPLRKKKRTFRLDRILEIKPLSA